LATTYKTIAQDNPGASLTVLYTVPASTSFVGTLWVGNIAAAAKTFRVAVSMAGATIANDHYLYYDVSLPANDSFQVTGLSLATTDVVRVYGSDTNVTFNLQGVEIT
jgi:hypothetical protein